MPDAIPSSWSLQSGAAPTGAAAPLAAAPCYQGVAVKADDDNTGSVYVGASAAAAATSGGAASGWRLKAGQSLFLAVNNANLVFLIGSAAGQNYTAAVC